MIPIFVPSYHRPQAKFLKMCMEQLNFPLYVFVREEDKQSYNWIKIRPDTHIVMLKNVSNIGQTRRKMIDYAINKRFSRVFMFDDDISYISFCRFDEEKGFVRPTRTINGEQDNWCEVLEYCLDRWTDETLIGLTYRSFIWNTKPELVDSVGNGQLQQCVGIDVKSLYKHRINYRDSEFCGNEDLFLQLECYCNGLKVGRLNGAMYECPQMGVGIGGCNDAELDAPSIQEKQAKRVSAFLAAMEYLNIDSDLVTVRKTKSGIESIKFAWSRIKKLQEENYEE